MTHRAHATPTLHGESRYSGDSAFLLLVMSATHIASRRSPPGDEEPMKELGGDALPDNNNDSCDRMFREVEEHDALLLPDEVVDLPGLRLTPRGTITLRNVGEFRPTAWARSQLARLTGITLDDAAHHLDLANDRLASHAGRIKVRFMRDVRGHGPAIIRALLDPAAAAMPEDIDVFRALTAALGDDLPGCSLRDLTITDEATYCTVLLARELVNAFGIEYRGGLHLRTSAVGAGHLALDDCWLHRENNTCRVLVAVDGVRLLDGETLPGTTTDGLMAAFTDALQRLPDRQETALTWMRAAHWVAEPDAVDVAARLLGDVPEALREATLRTLHEEQTRVFVDLRRADLVRTIGDVAHGAPPEVRLQMERIAGSYLAATRAQRAP